VSLTETERQQFTERDESTLMGLVMFPELAAEADDALRVVSARDFLHPARALIWAALTVFRQRGETPDIGGLHLCLAGMASGRQLTATMDVVTRECTSPPPAAWMAPAARRVAAAARLRKLDALGQRLTQLTRVGEFDDVGLSDKIESVLREIEEVRDSRADAVIHEVTDGSAYLGDLASGPPAEVIPTPWTDVNALFSGGGLRPGGFYILGGRPGDGKTLGGGAYAMNAAEQGYSGLFFSAEMTQRELMDRWVARALREELREFTSFNPSARVLAGAAAHMQWMADNKLRLGVVDQAGLSVPLIASLSRRRQRTVGLDFIVIDYLQLLQTTSGRNREEAVGDMSTALKHLAKELNIPVLALAQLNRAGAGDTPPRKEHLRETGRLEQDADGIMLLYRPMVEVDADGRREPSPDVHMIVDKNRHGRCGTVELSFRAHWGDITDKD